MPSPRLLELDYRSQRIIAETAADKAGQVQRSARAQPQLSLQQSLDQCRDPWLSSLQTPDADGPDGPVASFLGTPLHLGLRADFRGSWIGNSRACPGDAPAAPFPRLHWL